MKTDLPDTTVYGHGPKSFHFKCTDEEKQSFQQLLGGALWDQDDTYRFLWCDRVFIERSGRGEQITSAAIYDGNARTYRRENSCICFLNRRGEQRFGMVQRWLWHEPSKSILATVQPFEYNNVVATPHTKMPWLYTFPKSSPRATIFVPLKDVQYRAILLDIDYKPDDGEAMYFLQKHVFRAPNTAPVVGDSSPVDQEYR